MSLVVFTAFAGMMLSPQSINPYIAFVAILAISLGSGAAGAINMWYDRDIDYVMTRTKSRPIPSGRVESSEVIALGIIVSIFSVMLLGLATNWVAAFLLAFAIFFYGFIYTVLLKRSTPQNIVIGGAAGSFPPMIGWAAVTGDVTLNSIILFLIIFLWTPPHFWALALYRNEDYKSAKIPMMPVVRGAKETKKQIVIYSIFTVISTLLPTLTGLSSFYYAVAASTLGAIFILKMLGLIKTDDVKEGMKFFTFSIYYLFGIFLALIIDSLIK